MLYKSYLWYLWHSANGIRPNAVQPSMSVFGLMYSTTPSFNQEDCIWHCAQTQLAIAINIRLHARHLPTCSPLQWNVNHTTTRVCTKTAIATAAWRHYICTAQRTSLSFPRAHDVSKCSSCARCLSSTLVSEDAPSHFPNRLHNYTHTRA